MFNFKESKASEPAIVKVKHHSLSLAFSLFVIGLTLFLFLVGLIVYFSRKTALEN
jgi:hypothetical protein